MSTREIPWSTIVVSADPDHTLDARIVREYEFTTPGGGNPRTHEDGYRIFKGDYQHRGPYNGD